MALPATAARFLVRQRERLRTFGVRPRIALPEGAVARVASAAAELVRQQVCEPVVVGRATGGSDGAPCVQPAESPFLAKYARLLWERRRARGVSENEALEQAARPLEFAALMVAAGDAEAMVAGAAHATHEIVRVSEEIIEPQQGVRRLAGAVLMAVRDAAYGHQGLLVFADPALVIRPTASELADIAIAAAGLARHLLEAEPRVALLSFSTKGSAQHREVNRVLEALRCVKVRAPGLLCDGELQADAALAPAAGLSKAPGSPVAGRANTLVFPDLHSASIGYRLVERLGGAVRLGLLVLGARRPVNIVWRGCSTEDIVHTAVITAAQVASARQASG
ncbi:MAG: phosphate acyltransferase [Bryobacterales bacterium]|nr:phosphate acyltransferase [Bryobacteraceae bacterium]MDW8131056.1 phosphate acyltransferase [Bryobacterales bacterium]